MSSSSAVTSLPVQLPRPTARGVADQIRELGLKVGDVIVGRESYPSGSWSESRLTLLFVGKERAVFTEELRASDMENGEWAEPEERSDWSLDGRDWSLVGRAPDQAAAAANTDPAAIMDIVTTLHDAAKKTKAGTNLSEAYQGFDQFMREAMRCATAFETWATAHVEFEELDGVWAYEVGGHFMKGAKVVLGAEHADDVLLNLEKLDAVAWPKIAEAAGLPIVGGPVVEKPWMVEILVEALVGGTWEDAEWTEDKGAGAKPLRFATQDEAEAAIREHVATAKREGMDPRMSDYRAVLDPKLRAEVNDQPLPAANSPSPKSATKV